MASIWVVLKAFGTCVFVLLGHCVWPEVSQEELFELIEARWALEGNPGAQNDNLGNLLGTCVGYLREIFLRLVCIIGALY